MLILATVGIFKYTKGLNTAIMNISGIAALISLSPLLYGISYISAAGVAITVVFVKEK